MNAIQVPRPSAFAVIECEQPLVSQRGDELNREKRIAAGLIFDKLCERGCTIRLAVKRIRKQLLEVVASQGGKHDIVQDRSCLTNRLQLTHQWMRRVHFVIPVGADQHQMLHIGLAQQILDQIQRRSVEPLQIVEKQRQGMFRPSKNADKSGNTM